MYGKSEQWITFWIFNTVPPTLTPLLFGQHDSQAECGRWRSFRQSERWPCHFLCRTSLVGNTAPGSRNMLQLQTGLVNRGASPSHRLMPSPMAADATWRPLSLQPERRRRRAPAGSRTPMSMSCTGKAFSAGRRAACRPLMSPPFSWRLTITAYLHVLCVD